MFHSVLSRIWRNLIRATTVEDGSFALSLGDLVKHGTLIGGNADTGMVWAATAVQAYLHCSMLDLLESDDIDEGTEDAIRRAVRTAALAL